MAISWLSDIGVCTKPHISTLTPRTQAVNGGKHTHTLNQSRNVIFKDVRLYPLQPL